MHDPRDEAPIHQQQMTTTPTTSAASCSTGRSYDRSRALAPAPGVAEEARRQQAPGIQVGAEGGLNRDDAPASPPTPARRRPRQENPLEKRLSMRCSEERKAEIEAFAKSKGVAVARFMDKAIKDAMRGPTGVDEDEALDRLEATRVELARVGNNLNQIAKVLNSGGDAPRVHRVLDEVRQATAAVRAAAEQLVR